ncbi:maleylpyruvate isomerase N-terminal domain-containing protein [Aeromicrobium sp. IC_218]|uniref:maleylpyruvate isomerase N-terminal domain-containing protein n=1 Tax=Aeromicrobium sp. IC_218 TaxID=2545468 RepID=UPI0013F3E936|nr:maleylpyruvate isomerase N-terminal domain-containing protein [Aeromicrobium sp. IC_218]
MSTADLLAEVYERVTQVVRRPETWARPTRTSWTVHELLAHLLLDARRALVTLSTPADSLPDTDRVSYWRGFRPQDTDGARAHVALVRATAAAHPDPAALVDEWVETSRAAAHACRVAEPDVLATQGHAIATGDLVHTLLLEATVHLLDLTVDVPDAPEPPDAALAEVRSVLVPLARGPLPAGWDDLTAVLKGTGRSPLDDADRAELGEQARLFPLLG